MIIPDRVNIQFLSSKFLLIPIRTLTRFHTQTMQNRLAGLLMIGRRYRWLYGGCMSFGFNVKHNSLAFYQKMLSLFNTESYHRCCCYCHFYKYNNDHWHPNSLFDWSRTIRYVILTKRTYKLKERHMVTKTEAQLDSLLY